MTSEIGAPAAGAADGAGGLAPDVPDAADGEVPADDGVAGGGCPESPPPVCEHPATNNGTASSAAIRIPPG
jgi:hypothetical protein